jgi:hypothetical protein
MEFFQFFQKTPTSGRLIGKIVGEIEALMLPSCSQAIFRKSHQCASIYLQ